jgi:hypothetical protein
LDYFDDENLKKEIIEKRNGVDYRSEHIERIQTMTDCTKAVKLDPDESPRKYDTKPLSKPGSWYWLLAPDGSYALLSTKQAVTTERRTRNDPSRRK